MQAMQFNGIQINAMQMLHSDNWQCKQVQYLIDNARHAIQRNTIWCNANATYSQLAMQGNVIPRRQEMQALQFKGIQFNSMQLLIRISNARQGNTSWRGIAGRRFEGMWCNARQQAKLYNSKQCFRCRKTPSQMDVAPLCCKCSDGRMDGLDLWLG